MPAAAAWLRLAAADFRPLPPEPAMIQMAPVQSNPIEEFSPSGNQLRIFWGVRGWGLSGEADGCCGGPSQSSGAVKSNQHERMGGAGGRPINMILAWEPQSNGFDYSQSEGWRGGNSGEILKSRGGTLAIALLCPCLLSSVKANEK